MVSSFYGTDAAFINPPTEAIPIIACGDTHLDPGLAQTVKFWDTFSQHLTDTYGDFRLVLGGDIFKSEDLEGAEPVAVRALSVFEEKVCLLVGNHDPKTWYSSLPNTPIQVYDHAISTRLDGSRLLYHHGDQLMPNGGDITKRKLFNTGDSIDRWLIEKFGLSGAGRKALWLSHWGQILISLARVPSNTTAVLFHTHIPTQIKLGGRRQLINPGGAFNYKPNGSMDFTLLTDNGKTMEIQGRHYDAKRTSIERDDKYLKGMHKRIDV